MTHFYLDPLLYFNWGSAIFGMWLLFSYGPDLRRSIGDPLAFAIKFLLLSIAVGGCMYISQRAGDRQIEKLMAHEYCDGFADGRGTTGSPDDRHQCQ